MFSNSDYIHDTRGVFLLQKTKGGAKSSSVVDRLTDPSKYTGSHKERFDQSGKGKGIAGRRDVKDESGYVSGFKS